MGSVGIEYNLDWLWLVLSLLLKKRKNLLHLIVPIRFFRFNPLSF
ncbi:hypothetical protein LEP1GSC042_0030 [Leptospira kirschneri serovar Bim str. PUO 1247]|nr:hypothetical protein LEP1GSC042_0030 [Leptospira kirschneri serovar Bim str. PUO 1247]